MKRISVLLILFSFLAGCKKSQNDLLVGTWDLNVLLINGKDSTNAAKSQHCYSPMIFLGRQKSNIAIDRYIYDCSFEGVYILEDNNKLNIYASCIPFRSIGAFWDSTTYNFTGIT